MLVKSIIDDILVRNLIIRIVLSIILFWNRMYELVKWRARRVALEHELRLSEALPRSLKALNRNKQTQESCGIIYMRMVAILNSSCPGQASLRWPNMQVSTDLFNSPFAERVFHFEPLHDLGSCGLKERNKIQDERQTKKKNKTKKNWP